MKFTCDSCDAQYMLSDEKVGPNGVKVRCKKCSNLIVVRRAPENGALSAELPARPVATGTGEHTLERELGNAFDQAFGDSPAAVTPVPAAPAPDATQPVAGAGARAVTPVPAPAASEWYVAIGQAQVGPLPLAEVKRKWEGGDVGPDSLVWRPGMGDWATLASVPDLAAYLSPVPQGRSASARPEPVASPAAHVDPASPRASSPAPAPAPGPGSGPGPDVTWKPAASSALAALASEEMAARAQPEPRPEARPRVAAPSGAKSLVDAMDLPDGGVDPTGVIPLPIKGLEKTGEQKMPPRTSSLARGAEEVRQRRTMTRAIIAGVAAVVLAIGGAAAWVVGSMKEQPVAAVAAQPPAPTPAPAAPPPAAAAAAVAEPAPEPKPEPASVAAAPTPEPEPVPVKAEPATPPPAPARAEPPPRKVAAKPPPPAPKVTSAPAPRPTRREPPPPAPQKEPVRVAQAAPPAAPAPAPAPAKKRGDSVLDFEANDAALEQALGSGGSRSVYVPPAPGATTLPRQVSDSQVNETILGRVSALQQCVQEQKTRDPGASGVLRMRWTIAPDGSVRDVKCLTPEYASSPFAQCLSGTLRSTRFPASTAGRSDVTFPIKF